MTNKLIVNISRSSSYSEASASELLENLEKIFSGSQTNDYQNFCQEIPVSKWLTLCVRLTVKEASIQPIIFLTLVRKHFFWTSMIPAHDICMLLLLHGEYYTDMFRLQSIIELYYLMLLCGKLFVHNCSERCAQYIYSCTTQTYIVHILYEF